MVGISTYGLQIIRATDVIFLRPEWQQKKDQMLEKKEARRENVR